MSVRSLTAITLAALLGLGPGAGAVPERQGQDRLALRLTAYRSPLPAPLDVVRGFDPPKTPYGPGHLGVDLRARRGSVVYAAGTGLVTFAGSVAGRGVVVVAHPDGIRTEYEPVQPVVRPGSRVRTGQPIGTIRGLHRGCARTCLHWGARRDDHYVNPLNLLQPLGPVVLLPWPRD